MREVEVETLIIAISLLRGVASVDKSVRDHSDLMNRKRVEMELREKIWNAFNPDKD